MHGIARDKTNGISRVEAHPEAKTESTKRRILIIAPTPFFADRGCHVRILGQAKALQSLGNQIRICTYHLGKEVEGIQTVRTVRIPWYRKLSAGPSIHKLYIDLLLLWRVIRTCQVFRPDLIHAHLHEGIVIARIAGSLYRIPVVADLQGSLLQELLDHRFIPQWKWLTRIVRVIETAINRMPDCVVASSTPTAQLVLEGSDSKKDRITPIPDGVDLEIFYPKPKDHSLRSTLGITQDQPVVVYIGVLSRYQGIDLLLEAIPKVVDKVQNVKFLIMGYPDESYRQKAKALGVEPNTIFTGKIPYMDASRYLALGDIAISPKISTTEANQKVIAYMAMGLPTVVFDNPINREILGESGIYARNGNAESLAEAMVWLLEDRERAQALGEAGRRKATIEHSWQMVGTKLVHLYEHFGKGGPPGF